MNLKDKLAIDLKEAMINKDQLKKSVIVMLRAAIKQSEVDNRIELEDAQVIELIQKQIKQKKSALEEFAKASREDLVEETNLEIEVLMKYLPEQLSVEKIEELVKAAVAQLEASSMKDMGKVMAHLKDELAGKADNKLVSDIVKKCLMN